MYILCHIHFHIFASNARPIPFSRWLPSLESSRRDKARLPVREAQVTTWRGGQFSVLSERFLFCDKIVTLCGLTQLCHCHLCGSISCRNRCPCARWQLQVGNESFLRWFEVDGIDYMWMMWMRPHSSVLLLCLVEGSLHCIERHGWGHVCEATSETNT